MRKFIAVALLTIFVSSGFAQAISQPRGPTPTPRPRSLVAALGGRLAVLSSADGSASFIKGQFTNVSGISVTADGRFVIVGPQDCTEAWLQQVDIATGAVVELLGAAVFPVVNVNAIVLHTRGRVEVEASRNEKGVLAYAIHCDGQGFFGFTDLTTEDNARRGVFGEIADLQRLASTVTAVRPLAWVADGRTLLYEVTVRGEAHPQYYFGRLWPLVSSREEFATRIGATLRKPGLDPTAAALVNERTVAFAQDDSDGSRVREWDVTTGSFLDTDLSFRVPETITALTADPSGTHFLAVTARRALYRWSVGDPAPTRLAGDVIAAAWRP